MVLVVIFLFIFKSKTFSSSEIVSYNVNTVYDYTQRRKTTRNKLKDVTDLSYQQK